MLLVESIGFSPWSSIELTMAPWMLQFAFALYFAGGSQQKPGVFYLNLGTESLTVTDPIWDVVRTSWDECESYCIMI